MFKPLFGKKKLVHDATLGDRLAKVILSEAKQGKSNTLVKEVIKLRDGEWDRRAFYIDLAAEQLAKPEHMEKFPDTAFGNLVKGQMAVHLAWKARGSGQADTVTEMGWTSFYEYLNQAAKLLLKSAKQDSYDPTPLSFLQPVAMGLQLEQKIADSWFAEAIRRDPLNSDANHGHLMLLCEKWGGSHEAMYTFARETMAKTPPTSTLYLSIIYSAFYEHFLYLMAFDKDKPAAKAMINDRKVREESVEIYRASLRQRKSITRVTDYWPHNLAAWWLWIIHIPSYVQLETRKIGPHFTRSPWNMFHNDPAEGYQQALDMKE